MTWGLFWAVKLCLHSQEGLAPMITEVDTAYTLRLESHPPTEVMEFVLNTQFPIIMSTITEALRFSSSSFSIRTTAEDGAMAGGFEFEKGDVLICNTRSVHLEEDIYGADAATFKPDRFLDAKVKKPFMAFGGGVSQVRISFLASSLCLMLGQCEGRHFARKGLNMLMALLLLEFDIQLDPKKPSTANMDMSRIGMGILRPLQPTHILVKKRATFIA